MRRKNKPKTTALVKKSKPQPPATFDELDYQKALDSFADDYNLERHELDAAFQDKKGILVRRFNSMASSIKIGANGLVTSVFSFGFALHATMKTIETPAIMNLPYISLPVLGCGIFMMHLSLKETKKEQEKIKNDVKKLQEKKPAPRLLKGP